jgi:hypothetical protein
MEPIAVPSMVQVLGESGNLRTSRRSVWPGVHVVVRPPESFKGNRCINWVQDLSLCCALYFFLEICLIQIEGGTH